MTQEEIQYVCLCGCIKFEIFPGWLTCCDCGNKYTYYHGFLHIPKVFNGRRESYRRKEKVVNKTLSA